jgi:AraC-like DNA-binding protein
VWVRQGYHPLLHALRVTDAGFFPKAAAHLVDRPHGSNTELILACIHGAGRVCVGDSETLVEAGDVAWLPSRTPHRYESTHENPWTIAWAHFAGSEAPAWRALIFEKDATNICRVPVDRMGELALDTVHSILEQGYSLLNLIAAAAAMRCTLGTLARLRQHTGATWSAQSRVAASVDKLRANWMYHHQLEELAKQAGVSTSHYSTLFRQQTGFSPLDFILRQRIQHAATLLATTATPINAVASAVGYDDAYYFSRCFRKVMGCSPRAYRQEFPTVRREY